MINGVVSLDGKLPESVNTDSHVGGSRDALQAPRISTAIDGVVDNFGELWWRAAEEIEKKRSKERSVRMKNEAIEMKRNLNFRNSEGFTGFLLYMVVPFYTN